LNPFGSGSCKKVRIYSNWIHNTECNYLKVELRALRRLMGVCLLVFLVLLVAGVLSCCSASGLLPLLFSGLGVARAAPPESTELMEFSWRDRFRLLFLIEKN